MLGTDDRYVIDTWSSSFTSEEAVGNIGHLAPMENSIQPETAHTVVGLNPDATIVFRIRKTLLKMLINRGYGDDDVIMTADGFKEIFGDHPTRESLTIFAEQSDDPTIQLFVFFPNDEEVNENSIKKYCSLMNDEGVFRAIMVVHRNLTQSTKQTIKVSSQLFIVPIAE